MISFDNNEHPQATQASGNRDFKNAASTGHRDSINGHKLLKESGTDSMREADRKLASYTND